MPDFTQSGLGSSTFTPYGAAPSASASPQGNDFNQILQQIAGQAVQALPGLIMGLLSAHPVVGPQLRGQQDMAPQSLINFGVQTPFGGGGLSMFGADPQAGVSPQFNFGNILRQVAGQAVQALPGLIMGLLSAHPTIGPQMRAQNLSPQSLINVGLQTPLGGGGFSMFGANPQGNPQTGFQGNPQAGVSPQGIDFNAILQLIIAQLAQTLPGVITGALQSQPGFRPGAGNSSAAVH